MGASGGGRGPERLRRPPSQEPGKGDNMERTPEEIMKGLECHDLFLGGGHWNICVQCPYDIGKGKCSGLLESDALALIQRLEAELEDMTARYKIADDCAKKKGEMNEKLYAELATVKAERDAAVKDLEDYATLKCFACKYYEMELTEAPCDECKIMEKGKSDMFEWRGVLKEE